MPAYGRDWQHREEGSDLEQRPQQSVPGGLERHLFAQSDQRHVLKSGLRLPLCYRYIHVREHCVFGGVLALP